MRRTLLRLVAPVNKVMAGARDFEVLCEKGDESFVGATVGGWGGEGDLYGAIVHAGDGVGTGAGMDADGRGCSRRGFAQCSVCGLGVA